MPQHHASKSRPHPEPDPRELRLFRSLDVENRGAVRVGDRLDVFERVGLQRNDRRIAETLRIVADEVCPVLVGG